MPRGYVNNVCQVGQGQSYCQYLSFDANGFCCAKVIAGLKEHLDQRVADGQLASRGDNCPGWSDDQPKL